jgi:selenocysteine lyase/cysteine desulfurase
VEATTLVTDYRSEFADFEGVAYLNAALQGPMPLAAAREAQAALEWKKRPDRLTDTAYFDLPDRIREKVSRVIGARPEEIAVTTGASAGLASVAAGIDWKPGDEVLVGRGEFPARLLHHRRRLHRADRAADASHLSQLRAIRQRSKARLRARRRGVPQIRHGASARHHPVRGLDAHEH